MAIIELGRVTGKSAYEVAVEEGYLGTEAQWLISLKGETGPAGPKGDKGDTGAAGTKGDTGITGATLYTWIKYATSSAGAGMADAPVTATTHIGIATNKSSAIPSATASDYTWTQIKGATGTTGSTGTAGKTILNGVVPPTTQGVAGDFYLDTATMLIYGPKTTVWPAGKSLVGPQGIQGIQGTAGASLYTWIKYATSNTGAGISDSPTDMSYIGIATNKSTATKSTTASDYTWSLIKGEGGAATGVSTVVSVKDYGAKGDGATDDTTAIQTALSTGLHIYFPAGNFKITQTLVIDKPATRVSGLNSTQTMITQATSNIPIIRIKTAHYSISHINLVYAVAQTAANTRGIGIELGDAADSTGAYEGELDHVLIYQPYRGVAIPTHAGAAFAFENTFNHVRVLDASDTAFHLSSTGIGLTTNTFINCYALFQANATTKASGYYIANHDDFVMINCACDHGKNRVLTLYGNRGGTIIDFHPEACRLTENYMSTVYIENSVVTFTNLQVVFQIMEAPATEAYMLYVAGENSRVQINNFAERDLTKPAGAVTLSIVSDGLGELVVHNAKYVSPISVKGKAKVNQTHWASDSLPTTGSWVIGDVIWKSNPTTNSNLGWVCTTAGKFGGTPLPVFQPFGTVGPATLIESRTSDPASPLAGQMWLRSDL